MGAAPLQVWLHLLPARTVWKRMRGRSPMHGIIYIVGLVVVILAILSFFGLR